MKPVQQQLNCFFRNLRNVVFTTVVAAISYGCAQPAPKIEPTPLSAIKSQARIASVWSTRVGDEDKRGSSRFVPFVDASGVYAAAVDGSVARLGVGKGRRAWRRELNARLSSGVGGDEQNIYVSSRDGVVYALDKENGKTVWKHAMGSEVLARPTTAQTSRAVIATKGTGTPTLDLVVVRAANGNIKALDPADGSELWSVSFETPVLTLHGYSEPVILASGILVGLENGKLVALSLDRGQVLWESTLSYPSGRSEVERLVDIDANLLIDDSHIYAVTYQGRLARIEPQRGLLTWNIELSSVAGMAQDDTRLYVTLDDSEIVAVEKQSGVIVWRQAALRGRSASRPLRLASGQMAVADYEGYLHVLDNGTGKIVGRKQAGDAAAGRPVSAITAGNTTSAENSDTDGLAASGLVVLQNSKSAVVALSVR